MADLLPCPFCGQQLEISETFSNRTQTFFTHPLQGPDHLPCIADNINVMVSDRGDNERANAWNRRAPTPEPRETGQ